MALCGGRQHRHQCRLRPRKGSQPLPSLLPSPTPAFILYTWGSALDFLPEGLILPEAVVLNLSRV